MAHLIDKDELEAFLNELRENLGDSDYDRGYLCAIDSIFGCYLNSLEVKEVNLMIHTIIAECCDWLATHTNLSHDEVEGCRNLMLTVKDEELKAQKGE